MPPARRPSTRRWPRTWTSSCGCCGAIPRKPRPRDAASAAGRPRSPSTSARSP
jgi:hypothetical protein